MMLFLNVAWTGKTYVVDNTRDVLVERLEDLFATRNILVERGQFRNEESSYDRSIDILSG
jgi:hypothetical protein